MNLHGQIMNLPTPPEVEALPYGRRMAYKNAHRDARHAAAELALAVDAEIERLRAALQNIATTKGFGPAGPATMKGWKHWTDQAQDALTPNV